MMIAEGFTCQRYGFNVGADKFSLLTIENGKTSIMRLSEWTLISQSQKSHSDRLLGDNNIPLSPEPPCWVKIPCRVLLMDAILLIWDLQK